MRTVLLLKKKLFEEIGWQGIPQKTQLLFMKRTSHLLAKGYSLSEALDMLAWDEQFRDITEAMLVELRKGNTVDEAVKQAGFSDRIVSFLFFARIHRNLDQVFQQCSNMIFLEHEYIHKFRQILRYPIFLSFFLVIMLFIVDQTIFPSFTSLLKNNGHLPLFFIAAVHFVDALLLMLKITIGFLLAGVLVWLGKRNSLPLFRRLQLYEKTPLLKDYQRLKVTFLFATHFHSLLATGISLQEALQLMEKQDHYPILSYYASLMLESLSQGASLAQSIQQCNLLRSELTT